MHHCHPVSSRLAPPRLLAALAGLLVTVLIVAGCSEDTAGVPCNSDDDCGSGEACLGSICTDVMLSDTLEQDTVEDGRQDLDPDSGDAQNDTTDAVDDGGDDGDMTDGDMTGDLDVSDTNDTPCSAGCASSETCCDGECVDTANSALDCGACGNSCFDLDGVAAASCSNGACVIDACTAGLDNCDSDPQNGCESPTDNDPMNCGACGSACPQGEVCTDGSCACPAGGMLGDDNNCSACGDACLAGTTCNNGVCSCANGTLNDDDNCGTCGAACSGGTSCTEGMSGVWACECPAGQTLCGGICTDTSSDDANCGGCGVICPMGFVCGGGSCGLVCSAGSADCDADFSNGCETTLDERESCGSDCFTVRDCGGLGDSCEVDSSGFRYCECDDGDQCRPGERCAGIFDDCVCDDGNGCGSSEFCCNIGGQRQCIDVTNDPANCGACGNACSSGQTCVMGACQ